MKSKDRIKLRSGEWFQYYGGSFYLLIPVLLFGYLIIQGEFTDELTFAIPTLVIASIGMYWVNWNRLFFQEYKAEMTDDQFKRAVLTTAQELNWQITELKGRYAEAFRAPETLGNGGERITIKKTESKLFINSVGSLESSARGYSGKRNRENRKSFLVNALNVLEGKKAEQIVTQKQSKKEEDFWQESEWTLGKILKRLFGYGMTALFIFIGVLFLYEGLREGMIPIIASLGICWTYIKNDIQVIIEKNRRKRLKKKL
ncbi:MAG: hypothetical protein AAFN81_10750 [Bacteroidota bacterium]